MTITHLATKFSTYLPVSSSSIPVCSHCDNSKSGETYPANCRTKAFPYTKSCHSDCCFFCSIIHGLHWLSILSHFMLLKSDSTCHEGGNTIRRRKVQRKKSIRVPQGKTSSQKHAFVKGFEQHQLTPLHELQGPLQVRCLASEDKSGTQIIKKKGTKLIQWIISMIANT